jgi:GNAT superfamily N-acetyltransferase
MKHLLNVKPVQTRTERKQFLELPWQMNRGNPNWVPPLRQNQEELVGYRHHPFYDDAEGQTFLALSDGKPVGRVMAILNRCHNRQHKENRGFFGFFESIDDQNVAAGLFAAVRDWFAARGITDLRGPANPSMNYEAGLLIDGFDDPPYFMMTYNPPYYQRLIEGCGFVKSQDMFAFGAHTDMLSSLDKKMAFVVEECRKRFDIKLRSGDKRHFARDVRLFLTIYNQAMISSWGFIPMSDAEIDHMAASLKHLIVPELTSIADIDGKTVGFMLGLLDYNERIKKIDGRLFPFGFLRLLWNKKAIKRIRMISTNVIPEYQKWGVGLVIGAHLVPIAINWGMKEAEFSWVLETNNLSFGTLKRGGAKITKTYRMFDYPAPAQP